MSDHEARITALEQARRQLEDAFIVMTHLDVVSAIGEWTRRHEHNRK